MNLTEYTAIRQNLEQTYTCWSQLKKTTSRIEFLFLMRRVPQVIVKCPFLTNLVYASGEIEIKCPEEGTKC